MSVKIVYNESELSLLLTGPTGGVAKDMMRRGQLVENQAKRLCPVDTGRLRSSITHELRQERGVPVVRVGTNVKYAVYVHEGTGIYGPRHRMIVPVRAKALRFKVDSKVVYAKHVRGVRARPFLVEALNAAVAA